MQRSLVSKEQILILLPEADQIPALDARASLAGTVIDLVRLLEVPSGSIGKRLTILRKLRLVHAHDWLPVGKNKRTVQRWVKGPGIDSDEPLPTKGTIRGPYKPRKHPSGKASDGKNMAAAQRALENADAHAAQSRRVPRQWYSWLEDLQQ